MPHLPPPASPASPAPAVSATPPAPPAAPTKAFALPRTIAIIGLIAWVLDLFIR